MKQFTIIISILLIITALIDLGLGMGYYTFLRWIVTFGAILWAMQFNKSQEQGLFIVFCVIAFLFNPIIPVYLKRNVWQVIDFLVGVTFMIPLFTGKTYE